MLLADIGEEQLFESFAEIAVIIADSHEAVLDDVGHKYLCFVRLSTLIVLKKRKCYMFGGDIFAFIAIVTKL